MTITAGLVKELREKTGVGMMDCKKALVEASGDLAEAEKLLRKTGAAKAAKKANRATGEGLIEARVADDGRLGVLLEVNCETDFVARNEEFQSLTAELARHVAEAKPDVVRVEDGAGTAMLDQPFVADSGRTVQQVLQDTVAKIGENVQVARFARFEADKGAVASYVHTGGKIGVLVELTVGSPDTTSKNEFTEMARGVAMHVAAAMPRFTRRDEVPQGLIDDELEIARDQARKAGKPEAIVDKIATGKLGKFYSEICLLEQPYVRDQDVSVEKMVAGVAKELGDEIRIERFTRFVLGE